MSESPFDRYGIDPRASVAEITERMRELAQDASSEDERRQLRAAWESLTMHADARVDATLATFPETRPELGSVPQPSRSLGEDVALSLLDLLPPPALAAVLHAPDQEERALCGPPPLLPNADDAQPLEPSHSSGARHRARHGTRRS